MKNLHKGLLQILLICVVSLMIGGEVEAAKKISSISFRKYQKTITIEKGDKLALKVNIKPKNAKNKKLKWSTSNKKVVSVSSKGIIKGKKNGKATITVRATDGSKKKVKLKVIVGKKVSGLVFTNADQITELKLYSSYTLKIGVLPANASNKKVKWSTSNDKIATVDANGKVTGVSNGTVVITATATDGTFKKVTKMIKVVTPAKSVTVSLEKPSVYCIPVSQQSAYVKKGYQFTLTAEVTPQNATSKKVLWSSDNTGVASVSEKGVVTTVGCGVAVITAKADDISGEQDTFLIYVSRIQKEDCKFIAHRGRSEKAPANSFAAIQLGFQSGFDYVEFDIWNTVDGGFVVSHDESLKDSCGVDVKVTELTLAQAMSYRITSGNNIANYPNEYIISLEQVLSLAEFYPDAHLCIELKPEMSKELLAKLLLMINEYEMQDKVKIITFHKSNLEQIRSLTEYGGDVIQMELLSRSPNSETLETCVDLNVGLGAKYSKVTEQQVKFMHKHGLEVNVWNVPNFMTACHMVQTMKVDCITTDYDFFE